MPNTDSKKETICKGCLGRNGCMCALKPKCEHKWITRAIADIPSIACILCSVEHPTDRYERVSSPTKEVEGWSEEFDKKFVEGKLIADYIDGKLLTAKQIKAFIRKTLSESRKEVEKAERKYTAWCDCGDALESQPILNKDGMIIDYRYYCFGCDKTFKLNKLK